MLYEFYDEENIAAITMVGRGGEMAIEERHFHRMVKRKSNNNIKVACFGKLTVALICDSFEMIFGDVLLTCVVKKLSRNFKVRKLIIYYTKQQFY